MNSQTEGWALWGESGAVKYHYFKRGNIVYHFTSLCLRYRRHAISDTEFRENPEEERKCKNCLKEMNQ